MPNAAGTDAFPHLHTILLRDNKLSSWGDVDSLNRLTALTDLRLTGNPILNDAHGGGRYEVRHIKSCPVSVWGFVCLADAQQAVLCDAWRSCLHLAPTM